MSDFHYVRQEDRARYWDFCIGLIRDHSLGRSEHPEELWHYTTPDGLIGILERGEIWSTQVACLNDSLEQRYFAGLTHEAVKSSREKNTDTNLEVLLGLADKVMSGADFTTHGRFVTCFSEKEDDLGQWRGYGGGECGFAIGLRTGELTPVAFNRQGLLVPLNYKIDVHRAVAEDVVRGASRFFLEGIQRHPPSTEEWATQFLTVFSEQVDLVGASIKHHAFQHEAEWRLVTQFFPGDVCSLIFRQKRTLLARHLPINFATVIGADGKHRLPITRIYVGPGPAQRVSQVGVGDLLKKHGYENVTIELSKVPYRLP